MSSYKDRLEHVIPGGAHTYSRGSDQFPANAPEILQRGLGCRVWDPEDREYIDYGMALRSVTLGYSHSRVNRAAINEILRGNNLTRASLVELEAAEALVDFIPHVQMVKFAKNGSNATTAALKLARAFTGRNLVLVPRQQPFFSFDDWFIGSTPIKRGVYPPSSQSTLLFEYGDLDSLRALFRDNPNQVAAVMMEAATTLTPCGATCSERFTVDGPCHDCVTGDLNYLQSVQELCASNGALFILDEMITGFRWHNQGASKYFDVAPDLTTFGKAMANGFSVAAVAGKREIMNLGGISEPGQERTFLLSSTHGGEMSGLGAFLATLEIYRTEPVVNHLWSYGTELRKGLTNAIDEGGLTENIAVDGPDICLGLTFVDHEGKPSPELRTLFSQEMISNGVLMPWISVSFAHDSEALGLTLNAAKNALSTVKEAISSKSTEGLLAGPAVKPVFRRYN